MSVKTRTLLIVITVFTVYVVLSYGIQRLLVFPKFISLEYSEAEKDLGRTVEAIQREIHHLDTLAYDWAAWDDTYEFVKTGNARYIDSNLAFSSFITDRLNLIYILNTEGEVIWGEVYDLESQRPLRLDEFPNSTFPPLHPLIQHETTESAVSGILNTQAGPMLIASRPILTSDMEGPARGTLIMGRLLTDGYVDSLSEQTKVNLHIRTLTEDTMPFEERLTLSDTAVQHPYILEDSRNEIVQAYTLFPDITGQPALLIRTDFQKEITKQGREALLYANLSILTAGLLIVVVLLLLLQRTVLKPISRLTDHVITLGQDESYQPSWYPKRNDEIGTLAHEFNSMVEKLSQARRKLIEKSFASGKAEMAAGVLHNVRNAFHPLLGRTAIIERDLRSVSLDKVRRARVELETEGIDSGQREELTRYLVLGTDSLVSLVERNEQRLGEIIRQFEQVQYLLTEPEAETQVGPLQERFELFDLIEDAAAFLTDDMIDGIQLHIDRKLSQVGTVMGSRVILLQIFHNLLQNASESIRETGKEGEMRVTGTLETRGNTEMFHIQVCDTGKGIAAENLEHIFKRGFSTKQSGHSGIGLHWCANALTAIGGQIYAQSKGVKKGACFHVIFPKTTIKKIWTRIKV